MNDMNTSTLNKHQLDWFLYNFDCKPKSYILSFLNISERNYDTLVRRLGLDPLASYENRYGDVTRPNDGQGINITGMPTLDIDKFRAKKVGKGRRFA